MQLTTQDKRCSRHRINADRINEDRIILLLKTHDKAFSIINNEDPGSHIYNKWIANLILIRFSILLRNHILIAVVTPLFTPGLNYVWRSPRGVCLKILR